MKRCDWTSLFAYCVVLLALFAIGIFAEAASAQTTVVQSNGFGLFGPRTSTTVVNSGGLGAVSVANVNGFRVPVQRVQQVQVQRVQAVPVQVQQVRVQQVQQVQRVLQVHPVQQVVRVQQLAVPVQRVNVFGTRTAVDPCGQVLEADVHGNAVIRGNAFSRGFGY